VSAKERNVEASRTPSKIVLEDTRYSYGRVTRILHWSMAILVLLQFAKFADRINEGENWLSETVGPSHVSLGVLLLVLAVVRIVWAIAQHSHRPPQEPGPLAAFVKPGHFLLYAALFLMPVAGIMAMIGGGYGVEAFGITLLPEAPEVGWAGALGSVHSPMAWLLAALVAGHILAALYHHFVRRDNTLKRMAGRPTTVGQAPR
jgi:cytochrome b561